MPKYKVTVTLSETTEAHDPEDAKVRFLRALDAGDFDHMLMEADVEEVKDHGQQD